MADIIFLLGGMDLEMVTIREILDGNSIPYIDKCLSWGAKLSDYLIELGDLSKKYSVIYGVELEEDILPPENCILIDHHSNNLGNQSSIFQILDLLKIEPNPFEKMISVNDTEFIYGLLNLELSNDELLFCCKKLGLNNCSVPKTDLIRKIRSLDRTYQGITQDEESIALIDCKKITKFGKYEIVKTKLDHFSPIVDNLYLKDNFFIVNDYKFCFYGTDYLKIKDKLTTPCYWGGGIRGFVGSSVRLEKNKIYEIMEKL